MTYAAALAALDARQETRIELGLGRVLERLRRLGDPHEKVPAFHVAGTNGKGSTCAMLAAVLSAAGYRVGLYISPHLLDVRERISVGGRPIPERSFARLMEQALASDPEKRLTYFELLTVVAFLYFAESRCDVAVLETGLGGLLDATNVVSNPLAAIVTTVDYDHQALLGRSLSRIAAQKAGIFKPGRPAVFPDLPVLRRAVKRGRPVIVRRGWTTERTDWARGFQILRRTKGSEYRLPLLGVSQGWNAALARAAVDASGLGVPEAAWRAGLAKVRWPGRFDVVKRGAKTLIVDGAHNPQAARALARTWISSPWSRRPARWILGMLRDKDTEGILKPLAPFLRDVVLVRPPSPRALDPLELAAQMRRLAPRARVTIESDPAAALSAWRRDRRAPAVAVCAGSLYLAGAALRASGRGK